MKIITWNINSIRLRIEHLKFLQQQYLPDIICLQETKVRNEDFPLSDLMQLGYKEIFFEGEKSYNGVAILANIDCKLDRKLKFVNNDARHISVILPNQIEVHNFYIPSGGEEPDIKINPKFDHKLKYCNEVTSWFKKNRTIEDKIILVGDLNIAPLENDVWSHKQLLNVVSHTPIEVEYLTSIYNSIEFDDSVRKFFPSSEKLYSWWSYRSKDWKKYNRGRRLDHIWTTKSLTDRVVSASILKEARDWKSPSDHVPVMITIL